jgi:hypothetical protein
MSGGRPAVSTRTGYWWSGVAVGAGLTYLVGLAGGGGCGEGFVQSFFAGLFSMGLFGELVATVRGWRSRRGTEPSRDNSPADGVVAIAAVSHTSSEPNSRDPRFRRFVAMLPSDEASMRPGRAGRGTPPLLGRIVFASLFIGRDGKGWSDDEIARAQASLVRTGEWIEREAIQRGAAVNVDVAEVYFAATDPVREPEVELAIISGEHDEGIMDADAEVRLVASASRAASLLGFRDVADLARQISARLRADAVVWMIQPRSAGRSFVVSERETGMRGVSLAICYAREDDFPGKLHGPPFSDPVTFAHEALHLFGASDKYGTPLASFSRGTVTSRDVMRLDVETLSKLRIDPATAAEIGWGSASLARDKTERPH